MECPRCGHAQAAGRTDCEKCQIIFAKWNERSQAFSPAQAISRTAPAWESLKAVAPTVTDSSDSYRLPLILVGGAAMAAVGWVMIKSLYPAGLPIEPESYQSAEHRFAIAAPKDWVILAPDTVQEVLKTHSFEVPEALRGGAIGQDVLARIVKLGNTDQFAPSVNVVSKKGSLPRLTEQARVEATQAIVDSLKRAIPNYTLETSELVDVDNLHALRIQGKATLHILIQQEVSRPVRTYAAFFHNEVVSPAVYADVDERILQVLVPGRDEFYAITCVGSPVDFDRSKDAYESMIRSFRVLNRPTPWGSSPMFRNVMVRDGFRGMCIGLGLFFLKKMSS